MFTVKQVQPEGQEHIWAATNIVYWPVNPLALTGDGERAKVTFDIDGVIGCSVDAGNVFVMNDHGKTVANYDLGTRGPGVMMRRAS